VTDQMHVRLYSDPARADESSAPPRPYHRSQSSDLGFLTRLVAGEKELICIDASPEDLAVPARLPDALPKKQPLPALELELNDETDERSECLTPS
jgi:hypothetical protein